jgi:hypothetical protein
MLAITDNEQKLSPYVVFKHKPLAKEKFLQGIVVWVQESSWMTEYQVGGWIMYVWFLMTRCTITPVIHAGFRQLLGPDHRKCEGSIATRGNLDVGCCSYSVS